MKTDSTPCRLHAPQPPSGLTSGFAYANLLIGVGVLALIAAGGWAYYNFSWSRRLPQEHVLTDPTGHQISARLEARTQAILQITLLADGSTHYYPISLLADKDQAFVGNLPMELSVQFPLDCTLTDSHGNPLPTKVIGRNDTMVKLFTPDKVMQFMRMSDLSEADQDFLKTFPANLDLAYPIEFVLTDAKGQKLPVRLEGHTDQLVHYMVPANGKDVIEPLGALTPADRDFVLALPDGLVVRYPVDYTFTNQSHEKIAVHIQGRSSQSVRYNLAADGSTHTDPLNTLSADDQAFLQLLPLNLNDSYPVERTLTKATGDTLNVRLEGRSGDLIKFTLTTDPDEVTHYAPIDAFSDDDKQYIHKLPTNLEVEYPLDLALTDNSGSVKKVHLFGRTDDTIKFSLPGADGAPIDYPLSKLSALDQQAIRLMPVQMGDGVPVAATPAATRTMPKFVVSTEVQGYFDRLVEINQKISPIRIKIKDPATLSGEVGSLRSQLKADLADFTHCLGQMTSAGGSTDQAAYVTSLLGKLKDDIYILNDALSNNALTATQTKSAQNDLVHYNEEADALQLASDYLEDPTLILPAPAPSPSSSTTKAKGGGD